MLLNDASGRRQDDPMRVASVACDPFCSCANGGRIRRACNSGTRVRLKAPSMCRLIQGTRGLQIENEGVCACMDLNRLSPNIGLLVIDGRDHEVISAGWNAGEGSGAIFICTYVGGSTGVYGGFHFWAVR